MTDDELKQDAEKVDILMHFYGKCSLFELRAIRRLLHIYRNQDKEQLRSSL